MRLPFLFGLLLASPALAQPPPDAGADQLVGLFDATCVHFAGDAAALRAYMASQGAPVMAEPARGAFLAGRPGEVFDTSYEDIRLATISIDGGACEAVAEKADGLQVQALFEQAAHEAHIALSRIPPPATLRPRPGVRQTAYTANIAGKLVHIALSTEALAPQAVLSLVPK